MKSSAGLCTRYVHGLVISWAADVNVLQFGSWREREKKGNLTNRLH